MKLSSFVNLSSIRLLSAPLTTIGQALLVGGILVMLAGCTSTTPAPPTATPSSQLSNPASENCLQQGGTLVMQQRGDGGEYGVCLFEDNRQCEEWALLRGECPVGGLKITGYVTPAAQYCAITGGTYQITGNSNTDQEQGTCTFKNGATCDVWDYYNGKCSPESGSQSTLYSDPFAYCAAVGTVDAPDTRYTGPAMPEGITQALIQQGVISADAPLDFQQHAVWRCMDHEVWACHFGANLPCLEKADLSQKPTPAMEEFCQANPTAESLPAAVTGRATVYEWQCQEGKPTVGRQVFQADPQGYLADFWYRLTPPSPASESRLIYEPVSPETCQTIQDIATQALGLPFVMESGTPFTDPLSGETGLGCTLTATGTGVDFAAFPAPSQITAKLVPALVGWTEQIAYQASGPTAELTALTRDLELLLVQAEWEPAPGVTCPSDQPISACALQPEQQHYTVQLQVAQK